MAKLTKILAGVVLFGSLAVGCREAVYQLDEVPRPVEREVAQSEYPLFLSEAARLVEGGEQTYFECSPSTFAICSYDNPRFKKDTWVVVEALDNDFDKLMDSVKIVRQHYREKIENGEPIVFQKDGSEISKKVFRIINMLSGEMFRSLGNEDLNAEIIYNTHEEDMEFLWSLFDEAS